MAALVVVLITVVGASSAQADTTLTFDDVSGFVSSQYAGQGVAFGARPDGGHDGELIAVRTSGAHSGGQAGAMCGNQEVCFPQLWADFSSPHHRVSLWTGTFPNSPPFGGSQQMALDAFDLSGNQVAQDIASVPNGGPIQTLLTVASTSDIWFLHVHPVGTFTKQTFIDDLTFDTPIAVASPDFGLASTEPGAIPLSSGSTASSGLVLKRVNGSSGPINLSISAPPPGVTASVAPNPVDGPDGTRLTITLRASSDAPPTHNFPIQVTGVPAGPSAGSRPHTVQILLSVGGTFSGFDARLKGIEVTQGIQRLGILIPSGGFGNGGEYRGVDLAAGGKTIVRVYADALRPPPGGVPGVGVALRGFMSAGHRELPGGPLLPIAGPPPLRPGPIEGVSQEERTDPQGAYTFVLPPEWTHGQIDLQADILQPPEPIFRGDARYVECGEPACVANNTYSLRAVDFKETRTYVLDVLELKTANSLEPFPPLADTFDAALALVPTGVGKFVLRGPRAIITNHDQDLNQQVSNWYRTEQARGDAAMGVETLPPGGGGGQTRPDRTAIASSGRPFTAVAHELFHLLGFQHASAACRGGDPTKPDTFENWPPDQQGFLQGIALDRRSENSANGPFNIISAGIPGASYTQAYDIMSYCALQNNGEAGQWVSPGHWETTLASLAVGGRRAAAVASPLTLRGGRLSVTATIATTAQVTDVRRVTGPTSLGGTVSPYRLIARGAAGQQLADVPMNGQAVHLEPTGEELVLTGEVPAAGTVQVDVVIGSTVLASRRRSAHAPVVEVLAPRVGMHLGGKVATLAWSANDTDGDRLSFRIDYSRDGGQKWTEIGIDAGTRSMRLPVGLFSHSRHARVRIIASDGFNEAQAVSGEFTTDGRPPEVKITDPMRVGARFPADSTIFFAGSAVDDSFAPISGRQLSWFAGRRLLGHGTSLVTTGELAPGRRRISLVARDRVGRTATAAINIDVGAVAPRFLMLGTPVRLSRQATRLTLRVASTISARLLIAGRRFTVGRRAIAVELGVPRSAQTLVLAMRLRSGGREARRTVSVVRF